MNTKQCGSCGGRTMEHAVRDAPCECEGERIVVRNVDGWFCPDCGEVEFTTNEAAERYWITIREALASAKMRQRESLRTARKRLGLKQAEAAAIFGGGINAFSEYERGIRQPGKSTVLLLELLSRHPELLAEVRYSRA